MNDEDPNKRARTRIGTNEPVDERGRLPELTPTTTSSVQPERWTLDSLELEVRGQLLHSANTRALNPGDVLDGHLEVVRPLGAGGMGEVFMARDTALGRKVAIKTLRLPIGADVERIQRFLTLFRRDAASTGQLNHPNIVTVHQFGEHEDMPFFVLELVDGDSLEAILRATSCLPELEVIHLAIQLCDALDYAHTQGVIHRDIKPANLMRTRQGDLRVLDFGIALMKKARGELEEAFGDDIDKLGDAPRGAGTRAYMAPEQGLAQSQDARVDVWAAGVTLFELLTGKRPYGSSAPLHDEFEPIWPEHVETSEELRSIIGRCLRVDAEQRTPSMAVLGRELRQLVFTHSEASVASSVATISNVVAPRDEFIGRAQELELLDELVLQHEHGVVTILGPGGVGKTRLVTQWAIDALDHVSIAQIIMCSLVEARTRDGVLMAIGRALEIPLTRADAARQVGWALQRRSALVLILDNCEHVVEDVAELLDAWLEHSSNVRVVSTSRVALHIRGERVMTLAPLEAQTDAVALYTARARQSKQGWTCPENQQRPLRELVDELDRLPLAIELAAARASVLPPSRMLARLSRRLDLLRSRTRGASDRQTTLRATIAWSWDLLGDAGKSAMAQLSVFEGRFTLDAAEAVIDLSDHDDEPFILDVLDYLVDASLLRVWDDGGHFSMLVSVRAFCIERLSQSPDEHSARSRHAQWFGRWTFDDVSDAVLVSPGALMDEADDLSEASIWALNHERTEEELESGRVCVAALAALLNTRGPFTLGATLLERVEPFTSVDSDGVARSLGRVAEAIRMSGDRDLARDCGARAIEISTRLGAHRQVARWHTQLVRLTMYDHDTTEAHRHVERALEHANLGDDARIEGSVLGLLGVMKSWSGAFDEARMLHERAYEIAVSEGDGLTQRAALGNRANYHTDIGELDEAKRLNEESLRIARAMGDRRGEGIVLGNLGNLTWRMGDEDAAHELYRQALGVARHIGDRFGEGSWLTASGCLARDRGQVLEAVELFGQAMELYEELEDSSRITQLHLWLAHCAIDQDDTTRARAHFEPALSLFETLERTRSSFDGSLLVAVAERLGETLDDRLFTD